MQNPADCPEAHPTQILADPKCFAFSPTRSSGLRRPNQTTLAQQQQSESHRYHGPGEPARNLCGRSVSCASRADPPPLPTASAQDQEPPKSSDWNRVRAPSFFRCDHSREDSQERSPQGRAPRQGSLQFQHGHNEHSSLPQMCN